MKTYAFLLAAALLVFCFACGDGSGSGEGSDANDTATADATAIAPWSPDAHATPAELNWTPTFSRAYAPVCGPAGENEARCHAHVVLDELNTPRATTGPTGYGPAQLLGAYGLTGKAAGVPIIALVDAYDYPTAQADLNYYSSYWGIPQLPTCPATPWPPTAPCFLKVNQTGGSKLPKANSGWALEEALDIEVSHAVCQNCVILLVEANSANNSDLMAGVDRARLLGAIAISNSYGSSETSNETSYDSHFNYPGIAFTSSSGDNGYGVEYPAISPYVVATGGTTLTLSGNTWVSETVWSGSGSGCSKYEPQPAFQKALGLTGCTKRLNSDVAADADPNTGAAIYDTTAYNGKSGWIQVGGTSLSSPLIAAVFAQAGVPATTMAVTLPYSLYNYSTNLHDITSGKNYSRTCSPAYLCAAQAGYDGPTGLGSPMGAGAF